MNRKLIDDYQTEFLENLNSSNNSKKMNIEFIGNSEAVREIYSMIHLVADSTAPVLITGESGTGKDVVARLIHQKSRRCNMPFIAINCAAVPKEVFESELFGYEQGAFTGANSSKVGYLEMANGGTLFFDELAEMNPDTQAKLLRVIENKSFRHLGGKKEISVDVHMLAATNKNIAKAIETGEMRKDLYYRFSVIEIYLPPLRERKEDILLLAEHFLLTFCLKYGKNRKKFSDEIRSILLRYDWPGNIRELRNAIERSVIMCSEDVITKNFLPENISLLRPKENNISIPIGTTLKIAEKNIILQTLTAVDNNKSKAADILGVSRKALYNKLDRFTNS